MTGDGRQERPGASGVKLFKEERFAEAILEFSKYLDTNPDDTEQKVAHYNRGMAHNLLENHNEALEDGEACIKIDPFWAKGYKCKALALHGMERPKEALDILLNGRKVSIGVDKNTTKLLDPFIKNLNKDVGYLKQDLSARERMAKENFCVVCNLFENDLRSDESSEFVTCNKCEMISYCSAVHKNENEAVHREVCGQLLKVRTKLEQSARIDIRWKDWEDEAIFLISQRDKETPLKDALSECDGGVSIESFSPVKKNEWDGLKTWSDWFSLPSNKEMWLQITNSTSLLSLEDLINNVQEALTEALTDPMTVFYTLKQAGLLSNLGDRIICLHVVGAEPRHEVKKGKAFFGLLTSFFCPNLRVVLIGPLLSSSPATDTDPLVSTFGGTYQEFLESENYRIPDCIVAFCPGLYVRAYDWTPVLLHAVSKNVPFLLTCSAKKDYYHTKVWLLKASEFTPNIVLDGANPFASCVVDQLLAKSNIVFRRNMFCLLLVGGQVG